MTLSPSSTQDPPNDMQSLRCFLENFKTVARLHASLAEALPASSAESQVSLHQKQSVTCKCGCDRHVAYSSTRIPLRHVLTLYILSTDLRIDKPVQVPPCS